MKTPNLTILIIGRNGQLAWELREELANVGSVSSVGRPDVDLVDIDRVRASIRDHQPDIVVNAAAYTAVDQAESEPELAMKINADAPRAMAEEARKLGALFITYSSDYVFDGAKATPYLESDTPNPINVYGATKLAGDNAVSAADGAHLIFRTSWVYGLRGKNFLNTIRKLAAERDELKIVNDQIGAPTWSREIARGTKQIVTQLMTEQSLGFESLADTLGMRRGVYNITAGGHTSWYGFAVAIVEAMKKQLLNQRKLAAIVPIPAIQYPVPALRPHNSRLSREKLHKAFAVTLPEWQESLASVVDSSAYKGVNRSEHSSSV